MLFVFALFLKYERIATLDLKAFLDCLVWRNYDNYVFVFVSRYLKQQIYSWNSRKLLHGLLRSGISKAFPGFAFLVIFYFGLTKRPFGDCFFCLKQIQDKRKQKSFAGFEGFGF